MNNKAFIVALYFVALFIVVKSYYAKGNKGMPNPTYITAPSYLYGVLGITSDFTGGLSTVLAAGLTLGLFYRTHKGSDPIPFVKTNPGSSRTKLTKSGATIPKPKAGTK